MKRPQCLILGTLTLRASIDTMLCDLADALRRLGVHTRVLLDAPQAPNVALAQGLVGDLRDYDGPRFIIDINRKSRLTVATAAGPVVSIDDAWNIPCVTMFESNPIHHLAEFAGAPRNVAYTVIDDAHRAIFAAFGIAARATAFLPHAGPPPLERILPARERPFDVLFIGNVKRDDGIAAWLDGLACDAKLKPAVARVVECAWEERADAAAALARALESDGIAPDSRRDLVIAGAIELYVNNRKRLDLLRALAGTRLAVCGDVAAALPLGEHVTVTGPATFVTALQLMDNAKLVLNTMPFRTGAHERVFYGLSCGAYVVSDYSSLLDAPAGISFLPPDLGGFAGLVAELLSCPLDERVAGGRDWYRTRHTWDHRARQLLDFVAPLF